MRDCWPKHGGSYSSPHLLTVDGVAQVVILSAPGAVSVDPADGKLLWDHKWEGGAIVQPAITADGDILINAIHTGDRPILMSLTVLMAIAYSFFNLVTDVLYAYADPKLEGLAPAQKLLLRTGPDNARKIKQQIRELAVALGVPEERLPPVR